MLGYLTQSADYGLKICVHEKLHKFKNFNFSLTLNSLKAKIKTN